jgi:hypothetical protein
VIATVDISHRIIPNELVIATIVLSAAFGSRADPLRHSLLPGRVRLLFRRIHAPLRAFQKGGSDAT